MIYKFSTNNLENSSFQKPVVERASFDPPTQPQSAIDKNQTNQAGQPDLSNQASLTNQTNHSARFSRWLFPLVALLLVVVALGGVWAWKSGGLRSLGIDFSKTLSIKNFDDNQSANNLTYEQAQQQAIAQFKPPLGDDPCFVSTKNQFCQPVLEPAPDGYGSNVRQLRMIKGNEPVDNFSQIKFINGAILSYPSPLFDVDSENIADSLFLVKEFNHIFEQYQVNPGFIFTFVDYLRTNSKNTTTFNWNIRNIHKLGWDFVTRYRKYVDNPELMIEKQDPFTESLINKGLSKENSAVLSVVIFNGIYQPQLQTNLFTKENVLSEKYEKIVVQDWGLPQFLLPKDFDYDLTKDPLFEKSKVNEGFLLEFLFLEEDSPTYSPDQVPNHLAICHKDEIYLCYEKDNHIENERILHQMNCYQKPILKTYCSGYLYSID